MNIEGKYTYLKRAHRILIIVTFTFGGERGGKTLIQVVSLGGKKDKTAGKGGGGGALGHKLRRLLLLKSESVYS